MRLSYDERQRLKWRREDLKSRRQYLFDQKNRLQAQIQDQYSILNSGARLSRYDRDAIKNNIQGLKYSKEDFQRSINDINQELNEINRQLHGN